MPAVFCGQVLASLESATSGQSATSQCLSDGLSALPGWLGRGKFVLDCLGWKKIGQRTYHSVQRLPGDSAPLGIINTKELEAERKSTESRRAGGAIHINKNPRKKPEGDDRLGRGPKSESPHGELHSSHVLARNLGFKLGPLMIGVRIGLGPEFGWECLQVHFFFGKW